MKLLPAFALLLLLAPVGLSQERGYAGPSGLKGVRRVFVDAGADRKSRERIVNKLKGSKAGFEIVAAREAAEFVLSFSADKVKTPTGAELPRDYEHHLPQKPVYTYGDMEFGFGSAYVPTPDGGRRVLFSWEGEKKLTSGSAARFASAFVREYKKANGLR
ncbi:MAG TPA: hypothetical protein VGX48_26235 [Pyrinomonadaceae bacterium]|jgi:hypothetical protein|nr:hypothetical protein [Pyrinomonadaceae bacterium]